MSPAIRSVLPEPDAHALQLSRLLTRRLRDAIEQAGGWIGFDEYMRRALYEPGLGYYSAGSVKLGAAGDFITAPELGSLFAKALARQLVPLLAPFASPVVVELGAGTGRLARDLLKALLGEGLEPEYRILEPSGELRERQRALLSAAGLSDRVVWLDRWSSAPLEGVILANEVADALPVSRFVKRQGGTLPIGVRWIDGGFAWAEGPAQAELSQAVQSVEEKLGRVFEDEFVSEIALSLPAWIRTLAEPLRRGAVLLIDYGLVRREYYAPERSGGTLQCHYRHRAHDDPFLYPGLQDISAWVDFSACADAGSAAGLEVAGFTTQGHFLVEGGAAELLEAGAGRAALAKARALKTLVLPGEMGERFKVLLLTRDVVGPTLPGRDFRDRL